MRKILEIGGGRTPYFIRYKIPWNSTDSYIAIDIDEKNLEMSKESLKKHLHEGKVCPFEPQLALADASQLNLQDESVDEIIVSNMLSAPVHHSWDRNGTKVKIEHNNKTVEKRIKEEGSIEDPFYIERKKVLIEALRVLKTGGVLSIYTDLIIYGIHSYEKILEELKSEGRLLYQNDTVESARIDQINIEKVNSDEFCCCFRAEVLPRSQVHRFVKI